MKAPLESLETQVKSGRDYESPPLHLWHPPLSGNISVRIDAQGDWYHDGSKIERQSLVNLFASILRREEDGEYYLVTPSEKWRIEVELHPLLIVDFDFQVVGELQYLKATLNTGREFLVGEEFPLFLDPAVGDIAAMTLAHGLSALCARSAWYRLVEMATTVDGTEVIRSGAYMFSLGAG
jgi:hypothetical protein